MPLVPSPHAKGCLLRAVAGQCRVSIGPQALDHLLLVADQHPDAQAAIDVALELAECFHPRITLLHGGNLRLNPAFWTSESLEAPDPHQSRLALLGLLWDVRKRWPQVSLCAVRVRTAEELLRTAAQHAADLLVLPEGLVGRFGPLLSRTGSEPVVAGAPCPMLIAEKQPFGAPA